MVWVSGLAMVDSTKVGILVFGKTGQVARCLQDAAPVIALGREDCDLSDPQACAAAINLHCPRAVINAAAYTAVDRAESEEGLATRINAHAPEIIAQTCAGRDIPFVHLSTDYVFNGASQGAWAPTDPTDPVSAYGRTKLAGEQGVLRAGGRYAILRTSWVFSSHGHNFVKTMLRLGAERDQVLVVADQIGGPTPAAAIAAACLSIVHHLADDAGKSGVYHFAGGPDVSWARFAQEIFAEANLKCTVTGITTTDYPTPAQRPRNSRLDCESTRVAFGIERPDWRIGLRTVIKNFTNRKEQQP